MGDDFIVGQALIIGQISFQSIEKTGSFYRLVIKGWFPLYWELQELMLSDRLVLQDEFFKSQNWSLPAPSIGVGSFLRVWNNQSQIFLFNFTNGLTGKGSSVSPQSPWIWSWQRWWSSFPVLWWVRYLMNWACRHLLQPWLNQYRSVFSKIQLHRLKSCLRRCGLDRSDMRAAFQVHWHIAQVQPGEDRTGDLWNNPSVEDQATSTDLRHRGQFRNTKSPHHRVNNSLHRAMSLRQLLLGSIESHSYAYGWYLETDKSDPGCMLNQGHQRARKRYLS